MSETKEAKKSSKLSAYVRLSRPFTLIAPSCGVFTGAVIALAFYGMIEAISDPGYLFGMIIMGSLLYTLINTASNAFNQVTDLDIDIINKPERPIPQGEISSKEALWFSIALYALAVVVSYFITWYFFLFTTAFIVVTVLYSVPPFRLKKRLWISNLSIGVARSWLLLLAGWGMVPGADPMEPTIWFIGLIMFVFLFGSSATKDFTDIEGDAKHDMKTLPVVYGPKKAIDIIAPFFIIPFLLIPLGIMLNLLPMFALQLIPLAIWGTWLAISFKDVAQKNTFENSPVWVHMYLMLITLQLGFVTIYLF